MKCGNCDNFTFGKCKDNKCYGGCEIDSKNRTVHTEQECIVEAEDLKCPCNSMKSLSSGMKCSNCGREL